jgi:hypothetical protein
MSGWTTNILAIAIVIAIGLALGWQITSWLHEPTPSVQLADVTAASARLPQISDEREFWTSGGLVKVQRQTGTPSDVIEAMLAFCREKSPASQSRGIGAGEAAFVKQLLAEQPLEESPPVALFQPPGQALMVVAIDRDQQRIIAWSFAAPTPGGSWSLYHFRPK